MTQFEFESAKFLPYLPEEAQGNPGVYGFELALWLSRALMGQGVVTSYPLGEDWGWLIEYSDGDFEVTIGCGSQAAEGDGYTGKAVPWHIFIRPHISLKQRIRGAGKPEVVARICAAIHTALKAEGIEYRVDDAA